MSARPRKPSRRKKSAPPLRAVGIGLADGGLPAFRELLGALKPAAGTAYVLAHDLGEDRAAKLRETLAASPLPARPIEPGARLAAGVLHVLPSGGRGGRAVDDLFASLAREFGERAVGVVLSGVGDDGARGVAALRARGATTLVQDPASAQADGMPAAAVATGAADFVLSPRRIAEELSAPVRRPAARRGAGADPELLLEKIVAAVRRVTGADFGGYKRTTLVRRIKRRMAARRLKTMAAYAADVAKSPAEARTLHEEILIHVTSFFRDPEAFEALGQAVFGPLTRGRAPGTPLRLWVPGCSTGEEVYSLAIALFEHLEKRRLSHPVHVFGTDISEKVVAFARRGKYPAAAVPARYRKKYFAKAEDGLLQASKALREACIFAEHDVTRDPPYSNLDLISCRNVLIYFDERLQARVLPIFHYALQPAGFLMLGPSESLEGFKELFAPVAKARHLFTRRARPARLPSDMAAGGRFVPPAAPARKAPSPAAWSAEDLAREADRIVLTASAPSVIVTESLDIVQVRGDTAPFLSPAPAESARSLGKAAHEGLLFPVTQAVEQAKRRGVPVVQRDVTCKHGGEARAVQLHVIPLASPAGSEAHFLVQFAEPGAPPPPGAEPLSDAGPETREQALERELQATRRSLESIIAKQQTTNEDLQAANEELRSRNEEYQSSLEELQTAHEELQSANEELATLNEELRKRTSELDDRNAALSRANDELLQAQKIRSWLAAIVDSSDDAIVSKDLNGVITSWNRGAERLFGYTAKEAVGRPITILIPEDRLEEEPRILARLRRGEPITHFETVRRRKDGTLIDISLSLSPIRDAQGGLAGISKIARDITERKRAGERLERTVAERTAELRTANAELESFSYAVAHDLRAPLRSISGFAQLLQRELEDRPDLKRDFQRIVDNVSRMSDLISGLLELARLTRQDLKLEVVNLSVLADAVAGELKRQDPERDAVFVIEPGLMVRGDAGLLRSLIQNLLENSWKFTSKHPRARIEFGAEARGSGLAYFVRDDGAGFDPAHAANLFNPFHRLHGLSEFPGTGIGLATARRIVQRHGGEIWADGAVGKGAQFNFTIAVAPVAPRPL